MALTAAPDSPQKFRRSVRLVIIRRGDIYYADLRPVVGSEQGGVRPVLIIQNDVGNKHSPTVICAAITSRMNKAKLPTHVELFFNLILYFAHKIVNCKVIRSPSYISRNPIPCSDKYSLRSWNAAT